MLTPAPEAVTQILIPREQMHGEWDPSPAVRLRQLTQVVRVSPTAMRLASDSGARRTLYVCCHARERGVRFVAG